jgi:hypothetical protein
MRGLDPRIHHEKCFERWMAGLKGVNDAVFDGYARP